MEYKRIKLTAQDKLQIGTICACCHCKDNIEYHHIVPLSLGGSNYLTNFVALCKTCHGAIHSSGQPLSLGKLNNKKEKKLPFDSDLFIKCYLKYRTRKLNKGEMAKILDISRPTLDRYLVYAKHAENIYKELEVNDAE